MSAHKFWIPFIIVLVAIGCMFVLFTVSESKYRQLAEEAKQYSTSLKNEKAALEKAERQLATLRNIRVEDERRVSVMVKQMQALHEQIEQIEAKNNENVKISEQNRIQYNAAIAQRDQMIQDLNSSIQNLMLNNGSGLKRKPASKPIHSEFSTPKNDIKPKKEIKKEKEDPKIITKIHEGYVSSWGNVVAKWDNLETLQTPAGKQSIIRDYNNCISYIYKLKKLTQVEGRDDILNELLIIHMKIRESPGSITELSSYSKVSHLPSPPPEKIGSLASYLIKELNEQKRIIEGIPVKRKKGKVYDAKVIRVYP